MLGGDAAFPEVARTLMLRGAELLVHVPTPGSGADCAVLLDRAGSNDCVVAGLWGEGSFVVDHTGEVLLPLEEGVPEAVRVGRGRPATTSAARELQR